MTDQAAAPAPDLPLLYDAVLDVNALEELFDDLAGCTELVSVMVKGVGRPMAKAATLTIEESRRLLMEAGISAVQVRYRFNDCEWCDTIMKQQSGYRLVRMRHAF